MNKIEKNGASLEKKKKSEKYEFYMNLYFFCFGYLL